jgi:hypothetical protein
MDYASYTFLASGIGLILMLSLKMFETETGRTSVLSWFSGKTNHVVHRYYFGVKKFFSYFNKRNAILLVQFVIVRIINSSKKLYNKIDERLTKNPHGFLSTVKQGASSQKGAVSMFLEHLDDEKREGLSTK